jgi:hypothetical protein
MATYYGSGRLTVNSHAPVVNYELFVSLRRAPCKTQERPVAAQKLDAGELLPQTLNCGFRLGSASAPSRIRLGFAPRDNQKGASC